jgi:hypothetical protein
MSATGILSPVDGSTPPKPALAYVVILQTLGSGVVSCRSNGTGPASPNGTAREQAAGRMALWFLLASIVKFA